MVIGASGQGKTEFLNLLASLNILGSVESVKDFKRINKESAENQDGGSMASKTSEAVKYTFEIGNATFTVIDTPGLGDTRGLNQDEVNVEKIK